jgi:hypothetical protein
MSRLVRPGQTGLPLRYCWNAIDRNRDRRVAAPGYRRAAELLSWSRVLQRYQSLY